jgi:hypothetical protein
VSVDAAKARRLVQLKDEKNRAEKVAEAAARAYRDAEADFWLDLEDGSDKTITKDLGPPYGVVQFQRRETITGRVLNDEQAEKALEALGESEAILGPRSVRKKVLNEKVRRWIESGQPLPEGVDFNTRRYVTVTKKGS